MRMHKTRYALVLVPALLVCAYALIQYGFYPPQLAGLVQFKLQSPDFHLRPWVYFLYVHIAASSLALLIGPMQIFRRPGSPKAVRLHRKLGKIYVAGIVLSSLVGIPLSLSASGGWQARSGFLLMDAAWLYTTCAAVFYVTRGRIERHGRWMLRSYAITFAAVTLRLYQFPLMQLFDAFEPAYRLSAWLCWTVNLAVVEWILLKRKSNIANRKRVIRL
ncbi:DUF2306 domain-containing protein [Cohnella ginsengisoli]|uniref:DUF2306 domain-containing protein n=1 Tax=Cohnella ginsengisoli TaxID=425004 RepID=A0A9X4QPY2_9BACL|nr:DUF2306 domain-containing protein [Cohnella ginsengisoli]MDG0793987.1 DUF2306 domain-containing protein [Cohnella ginsengisoli]